MDNPRINQCISCRFFTGMNKCGKGEDIKAKGFCYVYGDNEFVEEEKP